MAPRLVLLILCVPTIGLLLWNASVLGESWPYVVGILMQLYVAIMTFVGLMLNSWRSES